MPTAFEEISKLSRRCLHGWTVSTHVKFEYFLNIFIGVIATFMAREAFPWKRHMVRSQILRRAVEAWTGDIHGKIGGRSDRVHWTYSDIVLHGEWSVAMATAFEERESVCMKCTVRTDCCQLE